MRVLHYMMTAREAIKAALPGPIFSDPRWNFWLFSTLFSLNRAAATMNLVFAGPYLYKTGALMFPVFCASCGIVLLFIAPPIAAIWNARQTMMLGGFLFALATWAFVAACMDLPADAGAEVSAATYTWTLVAGAVGGIGAGFIWAPWGLYMSAAREKILEVSKGMTREQVTAKLSSQFAIPYLVCELGCSVIASPLTSAGLSRHGLFIIYASLCSVTALLYLWTANLSNEKVSHSLCSKATITFSLWPDVRLWLFGTTTFAFSFCAGYKDGTLNGAIKKSSVLGEDAIGYFDTGITIVGAITAILCGLLVKHAKNGQLIGITSGALSFVGFAVYILIVHEIGMEAKDAGYGLLIPYSLMGIGRGAYESVNKAVFLDFFSDNLEAASSNQIIFFLIAYPLMIKGGAALEGMSFELYLRVGVIFAFSLAVIPTYMLGVHVSSKRGKAIDSGIDAKRDMSQMKDNDFKMDDQWIEEIEEHGKE